MAHAVLEKAHSRHRYTDSRRPTSVLGAAAFFTAVLLTSCRAPNGLIPMFPHRTSARWIVALYESPGADVPATGRLFRRVPDEQGHMVTVKAFPALWSVHFTDGAIVRDARGRPALAVQLDRHASLMWTQIRRQLSTDTLAVCVDGVIRFYVSVSDLDAGDDDWIQIPGPWHPEELREIAEHAAENYKTLKRRR